MDKSPREPRRVPPMRIGVLTNYHLQQVGGAEEVLDQLGTIWQRTGHDVVLFSAPPRRRSPQTRPWNPTYRRVRLPRVYSTRFGLGRLVRPLRHEQRARPLDVLLASDAYWAGHVARLFSAGCGVPYVICSHGSDIMDGSRFLRKPVACERMRRAIEAAAGIAYISSYMRGRTHKLCMPRGIERLIGNGWPDEWQTDDVPPRVLRGDYILGIGRIVPLKGFQTLVEAFAEIRGQHPQLKLVIAGDGPYLPELIARAGALGLDVSRSVEEAAPGGVCFPGFLHGGAKRSVVYHAAAAVSPSIRQEPMSLTLFEILGCGVPVVGSRVGGTPDIVQPGVNGELFAAEDSRGLAACLQGLLASPERLRRLAAQAAASVAPFRWSKVAEAYLELFGDVLQNQRSQGESQAA